MSERSFRLDHVNGSNLRELNCGSGMSIAETDATSTHLWPGDDLLEIYRRTGAADDFERVVARYAALVYGECRRVTRDSHDAEDAAQLAFLALAIELRSGETIKRPAGWLQRVAKRQALKIVRSRGRRKRREDAARSEEIHPGDLPAVDATAKDATAGLIRAAIDALPEKHRLPIVLHYFGGMSLGAIAREMGMTRTAVGTRLHRARKLLGDQLSERGLTFDAGELSTLVALLVPATVIASLGRAAGASGCVIATGGSPTMMAIGVGQILTAAGTLNARPIAAAAAAVLFLAGTGVAWVGPQTIADKIRPALDLKRMLNEFFDLTPKFEFRADARVSEFEHDAMIAAASPQSSTVDVYERVAIDSGVTSIGGLDIFEPSIPLAPAAIQPAGAATTPLPTPAAVPAPPATPLPVPTDWWPSTPTAPALAFGSILPARPAGARSDDIAIGSDHASVRRVEAGDQLRAGTLTLDALKAGGATLAQAGGEVEAERVVVGDRGQGEYDLRGGQLQAGSVALGAAAGSQGTMYVSGGGGGGGGGLQVTGPGGLVVGDRGFGKLLLGNADTGGAISMAKKSPLIVRATPGGEGLIRGWGKIASHGRLVNNGRIVADGHGKDRTLDLSDFEEVTNTIENKPDGTNGWYAENGGSLALPPIKVAQGTNTYTWGESPTDTKLDLVNSLRFTARNQPKDANVSIALHDAATFGGSGVLAPTGVSLVAVWSFNSFSFAPTELGIEVRYDHLGASDAGGGNFVTRLIGYGGGGWKLATDYSLNAESHIIEGSFDRSIRYLAVGVYTISPDRSYLSSRPPYPTPTVTPRAVVTPEPAMLGGLVLGASLLMRRQRRVIRQT